MGYKKPKKVKKEISFSELVTMDPSHKFYNLNRMLSIDIYELRIKMFLYSEGLISERGFLKNSSVLKLTNIIAKRNAKGEIELLDIINKYIARYMFNNSVAESGNTMLAFLMEQTDLIHEAIEKIATQKDLPTDYNVFDDEAVQTAAQESYNEITDHIQASILSDILYTKFPNLAATLAVLKAEDNATIKKSVDAKE